MYLSYKQTLQVALVIKYCIDFLDSLRNRKFPHSCLSWESSHMSISKAFLCFVYNDFTLFNVATASGAYILWLVLFLFADQLQCKNSKKKKKNMFSVSIYMIYYILNYFGAPKEVKNISPTLWLDFCLGGCMSKS